MKNDAGSTDWVIGSDEVGYGAWAGPLVVVAVAVPRGWTLSGLKDSKAFTGPNARRNREALYEPLCAAVRGRWAMATRHPGEIDARGVGVCLIEAHTAAIRSVLTKIGQAEEIIVDGILRLPGIPDARSVPKADAKYPAVSAASVLAKVLRDQQMELYEEKYKGYDFVHNVGYGSDRHLVGIKELGFSPLHRRSYNLKAL